MFNLPMMEIERKFLVKKMELPPNLGDFPVTHILQGYLAITEEGTEIRLRKRESIYTLTVKSGKGLKRSEIEIALGQDQFNMLWTATLNRRVEKKRYVMTMETVDIELDIYESSMAGLITAEVEFQSVGESQAFTPPTWFSSEITDDERYKNRNLALFGIPL